MFVFREVAPTSAKPRSYPALFSRNRKADLTAVSKVATLAAIALSMMQGSNIGAASIARTRGSTLRHTDESPENVIIGEREVGEPAVLDRARDVLGRSCGKVIRQQLPTRSFSSWSCGEPRMSSCFSAAPRYLAAMQLQSRLIQDTPAAEMGHLRSTLASPPMQAHISSLRQ